MREIQVPHCFGHVAWFVRIKLAGLTFTNRAKATMSRADVAAQHESGSAIRPALENIRALRFLTNGVQIQTLNQLEQVVLVSRITQTNAQPLWLWLTRFGIENLKFAGQLISFLLTRNILASVY
jgi:hypothetical protein